MNDADVASVRANGVVFHYLAMGRGPLLLCLHGFPDHACSFRHQLRYFSTLGYRVVAPFMRGYAPTKTPNDATFYSADVAHDVVELVRALGATRATLLGHDWGAHGMDCRNSASVSGGARMQAPPPFRKSIAVRREPTARTDGSQASTEFLDCSVISNWTGRPVVFCTIVARCRTLNPEQILLDGGSGSSSREARTGRTSQRLDL